MDLVKSKDAANSLNVSQTTVKRWASHYPTVFRKDRFGHYTFNDRDMELLGYIKSAIEREKRWSKSSACARTGAAAAPARRLPRDGGKLRRLLETAGDDMLTRILQVERRLDQKADEVVAAQIRQHREELEELRRMIEQLASSMEYAREPLPAVDDLRLRSADPKPPKPLRRANAVCSARCSCGSEH